MCSSSLFESAVRNIKSDYTYVRTNKTTIGIIFPKYAAQYPILIGAYCTYIMGNR